MRRLKIAPKADWERFHALPKIHEAEELRKKAERDWIASLPVASPGPAPAGFMPTPRRDRHVISYSNGVSTWR
jgi:hypothetical protein